MFFIGQLTARYDVRSVRNVSFKHLLGRFYRMRNIAGERRLVMVKKYWLVSISDRKTILSIVTAGRKESINSIVQQFIYVCVYYMNVFVYMYVFMILLNGIDE